MTKILTGSESKRQTVRSNTQGISLVNLAALPVHLTALLLFLTYSNIFKELFLKHKSNRRTLVRQQFY
jgi:hypothetical protein